MLRSFEEIKEALHKGELTLPQLVENYLEQIEKNKHLNMYTKAYMMLLLLLTGSSCKEYIPGLFKDTCLAKKVVHLRSFWHRLNPKCQPHIIFKFFKL